MMESDAQAPLKNNLLVVIFLGLATLVLFFWLGNRSHHHWDEFGYMYAAAKYSHADIAAGRFEASNISGFFNAKIGHIMFMRFLFGVFGEGFSAIKGIQAVYTALIIGTAVMLAWLLWLLWGNWIRALIVGMLFLITPVCIYTGPKLVSEVPGLFGGVASLLLFVFSMRTPRRGLKVVFLLASAMILAGSLLARGNIVLMVIGGWFALWIACPMGLRRGSILINAMGVGVLTIGFLFICQEIFSLDLLNGIRSVSAVTNRKSPWQRLLSRNIYAFGPFWAILPFAVASRSTQEFRFYGTWLACSILPLVVGLRYMEERFLIGGAPAIAGMALLGGEAMWGWLRNLHLPAIRFAGIGLAGLILAGSNLYIQPRMTPYEVDTAAYENVMEWIRKGHPSRPILVPWSWSDYHYLRLAYPQAPVYLANSAAFFEQTNRVRDAAQWATELQRWYGDRWIGDMTALQRLGPSCLFLSWETTAGSNSHRWSWIWGNPKFRRTLIYQHDRYRVYQLEEKE